MATSLNRPLHRLVGLETEYAIRFSPESGQAHPGNRTIYAALRKSVRRLVRSGPGQRRYGRDQHFVENGGAFYYESLPYRPDGGLFEFATPECRGSMEALLYQRAQDLLLSRAIPLAEAELRTNGHVGKLGLLKNCRDADGHVYGAQENYECEVAQGVRLFVYRCGLLCLWPLIALAGLVSWLVLLVTLTLAFLAMVGITIASLVVPSVERSGLMDRLMSEDDSLLEGWLGWVLFWLESAIWWPVVVSAGLIFRFTAFVRVRRAMEAFVVSRPIISGAGTVEPNGSYTLSEKGPAMRRLIRVSASPSDRAIFDTGNLMKPMLGVVGLEVRGLLSVLGARQRLQLGLADANMADIASFLKVGTTTLVIDMAEAGYLDDAPRPKDAIKALHTICRDPGLDSPVPMRDGQELTALAVQRFYLTRARRYLAEQEVASLEARRVCDVWEQVLDALETNKGSLLGQIDWVTKEIVLNRTALEGAARKKADLRYHELAEGYFATLRRQGLTAELVEPAQVESAITQPPATTPARQRGRVIAELAASRESVAVSWSSVVVGGRLRGKVIPLSDYLPSGSDIVANDDEPDANADRDDTC